jgi:hypothetical protein
MQPEQRDKLRQFTAALRAADAVLPTILPEMHELHQQNVIRIIELLCKAQNAYIDLIFAGKRSPEAENALRYLSEYKATMRSIMEHWKEAAENMWTLWPHDQFENALGVLDRAIYYLL